MSYLVLARKWRPRNFSEVVGQPHVARTLQNAIEKSRIAHAYLFTGVRGVGKTSVARILAKALNCEKGLSPLPCGECSNCREIAQGRAVDVLEIDGASNNGVENIRDLQETIRYRPAKSRYKIYIIDEVHMLSTAAFNALLKTLEEPPEHVLFIFATTEPHKIPATILSRCQRFDFRRIPTQLLVGHLRKISELEQLRISDEVLYAVAREADGSMRDAQSFLEQLLAFSGDELSDEEILDILGVVDRRSVLRAGEAVVDGDVKGCLDIVDEIHRRGIDFRRFCQQLCDHFRNLLLVSLGEAGDRLEASSEEALELRAQCGKASVDSLHVCFQLLLKGEEDIRRSSMPKITLEMLLLRLAQMPRLESLQALMGKLSRLESKLDAGAIPGGPVQGILSAAGEDAGAFAGRRGIETGGKPPVVIPFRESEGSELSVSSRGDTTQPPLSAGPPDVLTLSEAPAPPKAPAEAVSPRDIPERWSEFVRRLQMKDPVLAAKLNRSNVVVNEGTLEVQVLEVFETSLQTDSALAKLRDAGAEYFGGSYQWVVRGKTLEVRDKAPAEGQHKSKTGSKRAVVQHPVVLQALEILGGELVDVRPPKQDRKPPPGEH